MKYILLIWVVNWNGGITDTGQRFPSHINKEQCLETAANIIEDMQVVTKDGHTHRLQFVATCFPDVGDTQ